MLCLTAASVAAAQPAADDAQARHTGTVWLGLMTDWALSERWGLWFDTHDNARAFFVLRGGVTHRFRVGADHKPAPSVTLGYAHLWTDPGSGRRERHEHRPWGQVVFPYAIAKHWRFSQRLRYDLRLRQRVEDGAVTDGFSAIHRTRYQTVLSYDVGTIPFGTLFLQLANEVLIHLGQGAPPNQLDQDRISALLGLRMANVTLRLGYMDRYLPKSGSRAALHEHSVVLWWNQRFPFRRRPSATLPEASNP